MRSSSEIGDQRSEIGVASPDLRSPIADLNVSPSYNPPTRARLASGQLAPGDPVRRTHLALLLLATLPSAAPLVGQSSTIEQVGWLAGCWELRTANRLTLEMWMPPAGGMMLGASRTTMGDRVREFEQLQLVARGDTLIYTATPSGQAQASFRSAAPVAAGELVVENLAHDFPQRIRYRRISADSMVARVEGPGQGGAMRGFDLPMRRVKCEV